MRIRKAIESDLEIILGIWKESGLLIRPKGRDRINNLKQQLQSENLWFHVAETGSKIVGVILVTHDERKGWINRLAVLPDYRNQGIATKLLEEAEKSLLAIGIGVFSALILNENNESQNFFKKQGYKSHEDIVYFSKRLNEDI